MPEFELGNLVSFSKPIYRTTGSKGSRKWMKHGFSQPVQTGIIIGWRTLSNGSVSYGYDEPNEYSPEEYFKAYLVVTDMRQKPVSVLAEDLTLKEIEYEWGTVYEVSSTQDVFTEWHSEERARKEAAASPTDTGVVRRPKRDWVSA